MAEFWAEECQEDLQMTGNVTENMAAVPTIWWKMCFCVCKYCSVRIRFLILRFFFAWWWCFGSDPFWWPSRKTSHLHFWHCFSVCKFGRWSDLCSGWLSDCWLVGGLRVFWRAFINVCIFYSSPWWAKVTNFRDTQFPSCAAHFFCPSADVRQPHICVSSTRSSYPIHQGTDSAMSTARSEHLEKHKTLNS